MDPEYKPLELKRHEKLQFVVYYRTDNDEFEGFHFVGNANHL